jgi:FkbM family methyltransferase
MTDQNVIYDVGVNDGRDSEYYLHRGFKVVGIEASPPLADALRRKFAREIKDGRFTLLNVGIAEQEGELDFWVCESRSEWSSFLREVASRDGSAHHVAKVRTTTFDKVLQEHGVPYYCKIDIEGHDWLCLKGMTRETRPRYTSIEMSYQSGDRDLTLLKGLGYTRFKLVSQVSFAQPWPLMVSINPRLPYRLRRMSLNAEGRIRGKSSVDGWTFDRGSSGPFGEDTPGPWRNLDYVHGLWTKLHELNRDGRLLGSWFDVHATA